MAHTLRKVNLGNTAIAEIIITDYTHGGESFTLAELGLTGAIQSIQFMALIGFFNWIPVVSSNLVLLKDPTLSYEAPTMTGINYTFLALVHAT